MKRILSTISNLYGMIADWLDGLVLKYFFTRKQLKVIKSVRFKDLFDNEITIAVGQETALSNEENAKTYIVESISVNKNRIAIIADEMTNHFEAVKICNILFEDVDERKVINSKLSRIILRAKELELIQPIQANELIKQLKEQSNGY